MASEAVSCITYQSDQLSLIYFLSVCDKKLTAVCVSCLSSVFMLDEYYISVDHSMDKEHYISFLAAVSDQSVQFVKMYPEGQAEARFKINRVRKIYAYCNRHGLFQVRPEF